MSTFYLSIKSVNLPHYFSSACICPTAYIDNRNDDIQSTYPEQLLFSATKFIHGCNCALEIVLNEHEEPLLQEIIAGFYLYHLPLPISRVRKVIFTSKEQSENSLFNINSGTAFLPHELVCVEEGEAPSKPNLPQAQNGHTQNRQAEIKRFDKVLGGFALMKIVGGEFDNYPLNYFAALAGFNKRIATEFAKLNVSEANNYQWIFVKESDKSKYPSVHKIVYKQVTPKVVEAYAEHEKVNLKKAFGKYVIDDIDESSMTYTLAILNSYAADGARLTLDNFISDLVRNKFSLKKREPLALTFGVNKGYAVFRNNYKTANFDIDVKFKLNSQFDYYAIESIYQFVFNGISDNGTFDYIDDWCPRLEPSAAHTGYDTFQILDKAIHLKKKQSNESLFDSVWQDSSIGEIRNIFIGEIVNTEKLTNYFNQTLVSSIQKWCQVNYEKNEQSFNEPLAQKTKLIDELSKENQLKDQKIQALESELAKSKQLYSEGQFADQVTAVTCGAHNMQDSGDKAKKQRYLKRKNRVELLVIVDYLGLVGANLKKDQLVAAILEREFP